MKRATSFFSFVLIACAMVALDRTSKAWAVENLIAGERELDLGPVNLTMVHNTGAAFGVGQGNGQLFVAIAVAIVAVIVIWLLAMRRHGVLEVLALSLIAAGGIGNLIDRMCLGYVIDFIEFTFVEFPVFNVADICVTCGVALLFVYVLFLADFSDDKEHGA